MKRYSSTHYLLHCYENSLADLEISEIKQEQEKVILELEAFFGVKVPFQIEYFLVETAEEVGIIYGDNEPCNGFAEAPNKVYAVYNQDVKCIGYHEDAHLISYLVGKPFSVFIKEGIAMYFDKTWHGMSNDEWVRKFLKNSQYESIQKLFSNNYFYELDSSITYPIAGSFTKYLIEKFGKERYLDFYRKCQEEYEPLFIDIYHMNIAQLEKAWLDAILI